MRQNKDDILILCSLKKGEFFFIGGAIASNVPLSYASACNLPSCHSMSGIGAIYFHIAIHNTKV